MTLGWELQAPLLFLRVIPPHRVNCMPQNISWGTAGNWNAAMEALSMEYWHVLDVIASHFVFASKISSGAQGAPEGSLSSDPGCWSLQHPQNPNHLKKEKIFLFIFLKCSKHVSSKYCKISRWNVNRIWWIIKISETIRTHILLVMDREWLSLLIIHYTFLYFLLGRDYWNQAKLQIWNFSRIYCS